MTTTQVNIRLDSDLKSEMEKVCKKMGITMSSAFSMFAAKVATEKRIPFEVCADPFYSEANMAHLRESIRQIEEGKAEAHDLIPVP